ncbi:DUF5336 domain-containing protein [Streptomyces formicae]|uniref:Integral membrane protein n=1 Tax=Streptomyces formicae TaxID=1616117 RepID=A0ABY3WQ94_9ACTN|nr:DUF5336 domain-containing protein [Streptomyces formicae]UNM14819.1 hypothetical protein J4032_28135 [Streptomyces formicae]
MNIRSLTRGDGVVIGAAVLLFIASFLDVISYDAEVPLEPPSAWATLGNALGVYMVGVIGAALIVIARGLPQPRKIAGIDLGQFGVAAAIITFWNFFWTIVDLGEGVSAGAGLILGLISSLILAAAAVATPLVPALKGALLPAPRPQAPQPYGMQPGQPGQPGAGYGYPGAQQQPYGMQQPGQPQPYGVQPQHGQPGPQQGGPAAGPAGADFAPFWFAVPVARPLYAEDGSPTPVAELAPGTWYLAVEQRGPGLVAQTQDGRRGVLQDTSGIQRG